MNSLVVREFLDILLDKGMDIDASGYSYQEEHATGDNAQETSKYFGKRAQFSMLMPVTSDYRPGQNVPRDFNLQKSFLDHLMPE